MLFRKGYFVNLKVIGVVEPSLIPLFSHPKVMELPFAPYFE